MSILSKKNMKLSFHFCHFSFLVLIALVGLSQGMEPGDWGEDHIGKALPEYVTGDECLFCHRNDIGVHWQENRHNRTMRIKKAGEFPISELEKIPALKTLADETEFLLGEKKKVHFLKPGASYGKPALSSVEMIPANKDQPAKILNGAHPAWDDQKFVRSCAGCHATAVDGKALTISAISLECYTCHGSVTLDHTTNTQLMLLSKKREDPARVVASICGQCHLREGKSKSSGLPYPNQFIAGDNLFKDYQADFSDEHLKKLNPGDRHIYENIRDIVLKGETRTTCLTCHEVHKNSSAIHRGVRNSTICLDCHPAQGPKKQVIAYEVHSELCGY